MCKIITKDGNGRIIRRSLETAGRNVVRVTEFGVYESGVRRSERMSLKSIGRGSYPVRPFSIK